MESPASGPTRSRAWIWLVRVGVLAILAFHAAVLAPRVLRADCPVRGIDAADYVLFSESLAEGKGYVEPYTPGNPPHTRLPPLFPALLAVLRLAGGSIVSFHGFVLACSLLGLLLIWVYLRPLLGDGWALAVMAATALTPLYIEFSGRLMTEVPYVALLYGALLLLRRCSTQPEATLRVHGGACLAVAAAPLLRTVGVSLLPAAFLYLWCSKLDIPDRRRRAVLLVALAALPIVLWTVRNACAGVSGGRSYIDYWRLRDPYELQQGATGSADFLPRAGGNLLRGLGENLLRYADYATQLAAVSLPGSVGSHLPSAVGWLAILWNFIVPGFVAIGAWRLGRDPRDPASRYLPFFLGILLLWPWYNLRFLVPVFPLLLAYFLHGLLTTCSWWVGRSAWRRPASCLLAAMVLAVWFYPRITRHSWAVSEYLEENPHSTAGRESFRRLKAWLEANAASDDVILSRFPQVVKLTTGHDCVEFDRTPGPQALDRVLARYRVKWILFTDADVEAFVESELRGNRSRFALVFHDGPLRLYSVGSP